MKLSELLKNQAAALYSQSVEHTAVTLLKQAGMDEETARIEVAQKMMEKEATSKLVEAGVNYDEAVKLVKVAGVKIQDMGSFKPELTFEEKLAAELEKAASVAEELEAKAEHAETLFEKVAELEQALDAKPEQVEVPEAITKFAESGTFTNDDLQALMKLPTDTLSKVASHKEEAWKMGKSAGVAENAVDPFTAFLLS